MVITRFFDIGKNRILKQIDEINLIMKVSPSD